MAIILEPTRYTFLYEDDPVIQIIKNQNSSGDTNKPKSGAFRDKKISLLDETDDFPIVNQNKLTAEFLSQNRPIKPLGIKIINIELI